MNPELGIQTKAEYVETKCFKLQSIYDFHA